MATSLQNVIDGNESFTLNCYIFYIMHIIYTSLGVGIRLVINKPAKMGPHATVC